MPAPSPCLEVLTMPLQGTGQTPLRWSTGWLDPEVRSTGREGPGHRCFCAVVGRFTDPNAPSDSDAHDVFTDPAAPSEAHDVLSSDHYNHTRRLCVPNAVNQYLGRVVWRACLPRV